MAIMLTKRSSIFLKQQQTLPVPPDGFIETNKPILVVPQFSKVTSNRMSGHMNSSYESVDTCRSKASFDVATDIRATGTTTLGVKPSYAEIMKISGFKELGTQVTDTFELINNTGSIPYGSAVVYMDDHKFNFTNTLAGSLTATFTIGTPSVMSVVCSGYIDDVKATAEANPTVTLSDEKALIVSCADVMLFDGTVVPTESIVIKTSPVIAESYTMGGLQGLRKNVITDYSLTLEATFPVEGTDYATHAGLIESGIPKSIRIVLGNDKTLNTPIDGESVVILCATTKVVDYTDSDNNGMLYRTVTYKLEDDTAPALRWITGKTAGL